MGLYVRSVWSCRDGEQGDFLLLFNLKQGIAPAVRHTCNSISAARLNAVRIFDGWPHWPKSVGHSYLHYPLLRRNHDDGAIWILPTLIAIDTADPLHAGRLSLVGEGRTEFGQRVERGRPVAQHTSL